MFVRFYWHGHTHNVLLNEKSCNTIHTVWGHCYFKNAVHIFTFCAKKDLKYKVCEPSYQPESWCLIKMFDKEYFCLEINGISDEQKRKKKI